MVWESISKSLQIGKGRDLLLPMFAEFAGTALLVGIGLSFVILDFGSSSPIKSYIPSSSERRLLTGFLFGSVGASIALSPLGRISGAHINPVVTLAFFFRGKISSATMITFVGSQMFGALVGSCALLLWGSLGQSVDYGATIPGYGGWAALAGETATTFCLILSLFGVLSIRRIRSFAPFIFPPLYAAMVWIEAPISGTSTNPARSFGPAVVSGVWTDFWIYLIGPLIGTVLALAMFRLSILKKLELEVAKVHHFPEKR